MKIAFHDNMLTLRGTTVALYDYAYYNKKLLNNESIILFNETYSGNDLSVYRKFQDEFEVFPYKDKSEINRILSSERCESFFAIKGGKNDGIISNVCRNLIMAVSGDIKSSDAHGDKYFVCSPWLSEISGFDFVPHMINLPYTDENLRKELNIPSGGVVFGRNGGYETFDLNFVKKAIYDILQEKDDYYFLFQNTESFIDHPRVIFLPPSPDLNFKVKFINTCDAHLHARFYGESFGLTCGEFSTKNKPIITWNGSPERNHIQVLGSKALVYNQYSDLMKIFREFRSIKNSSWNCYQDYTPDRVMAKFKFLYDV
jgi:hypothetical protein